MEDFLQSQEVDYSTQMMWPLIKTPNDVNFILLVAVGINVFISALDGYLHTSGLTVSM